MYCHKDKGLFLSIYVDDFKMAGRADQLEPMWKYLKTKIDLEPAVPVYENVYLGCGQSPITTPEKLIAEKSEMLKRLTTKSLSSDSAVQDDTTVPANAGGAEDLEKPPVKKQRRRKRIDINKENETPNTPTIAAALNLSECKAYCYKMCGHAEQCVEKYLELAKTNISALKPVSTPCLDDHQIAPEDFEAKGVLSDVASKIVLKCLYLARIGRPDILWTVNSLAREVTKWSAACDQRLFRLICYLHCTKKWVQAAWIGDKIEDCYLACFCDASFAGDLRDSKSTTGALLCLVGPQTFVPITWICKKQGAVSHSSSEAEVIALDSAVRMEGIPCLDLWEMVVSVLGNPKNGSRGAEKPTEQHVQKMQSLIAEQQILLNVDYVPCNIPEPKHRSKLIVFEDNEAVIKMTIKGRSPNMRHVARTHRIDLDWLFERISRDPSILIKYVGTKEQIADMLTKGSFTALQWKTLCGLAQIGEFS